MSRKEERTSELQVTSTNLKQTAAFKMWSIASIRSRNLNLKALLSMFSFTLITIIALQVEGSSEEASSLPGVSRDLQTFCSARPSLPIDLASMIVHVKRDTSFNYKLYLFSGQDYVFQTGQIVPRDDFRIHSFPVKMKKLSEFWPQNVAVFRETTQNDGNSTTGTLMQPIKSTFNLRRFFALVPNDLEQASHPGWPESGSSSKRIVERQTVPSKPSTTWHMHDVVGEPLPGDPVHHDVALVANHRTQSDETPTGNERIQFDRDDQVALLNGPPRSKRLDHDATPSLDTAQAQSVKHRLQMLMPVSAFSSFHVNSTYLVRKDFGQTSSEVIRIVVDSHRFQIMEVHLITNDQTNNRSSSEQRIASSLSSQTGEELSFLNHKLLRDAQTRITSINQVYEDWITRNFYTIVYIQRKLNLDEKEELMEPEIEDTKNKNGQEIITERLVFRGSSMVLLGADQLDYSVKASAFITEKNGLHYYLEFLAEKQKFYLGAIDWSKRPFKFIDAQAFPMKHTRTMYDNEELLLCPPSICYSEQPIEEIVAYGRIPLDRQLQQEASILAQSSSGQNSSNFNIEVSFDDTSSSLAHLLLSNGEPVDQSNNTINMDRLIGELRAGWRSLELKLHLRDWTWSLERQSRPSNRPKQALGLSSSSRQLQWRLSRPRRNELKASRDSYGFALSGHEIDASFRVFNELYLISANQLISINYTQPNETTISAHLIQDEFPGLSSTLVDPITGAFYERHANQLFFFKGDRYVGYDYASKKPLEDFQLPPALTVPIGTDKNNVALTNLAGITNNQHRANPERASVQPLVSTLPVVGIFGRQHYVDAIYHDLFDDLVYVFTGMKYYSYSSNDFKDGAFRHKTGLPRMQCINQNFLLGCQFDAVYPNPCQTEEDNKDSTIKPTIATDKKSANLTVASEHSQKVSKNNEQEVRSNFNQQQQTRLRSIAAGRHGGLMDFLVDNAFVSRAVEPILFPSSDSERESILSSMLASSERSSLAQERIVVYILLAMIFITILVTIVMLFAIVQWTRMGSSKESTNRRDDGKQSSSNEAHRCQDDQMQLRHYTSSTANQNINPVGSLPSRIRHDQHQQLQQLAPLHYATGWLHQYQDSTNRGRLQSPVSLLSTQPPSSQFSASNLRMSNQQQQAAGKIFRQHHTSSQQNPNHRRQRQDSIVDNSVL